MTQPSPLESAAAALREAVERQDFAAVEASARRYAEFSRAAMAVLPLAQAEALMTDTRQLLEWSRRKMCVARAKIGERTKRLERVAGYLPPARAAHTWSVEA